MAEFWNHPALSAPPTTEMSLELTRAPAEASTSVERNDATLAPQLDVAVVSSGTEEQEHAVALWSDLQLIHTILAAVPDRLRLGGHAEGGGAGAAALAGRLRCLELAEQGAAARNPVPLQPESGGRRLVGLRR